MIRTQFKASELQIIARTVNALLLMADEPQCPRAFRRQIEAQVDLLYEIVTAHGLKSIGDVKKSTDGIVHEWPESDLERLRALR